MINGAQLYQERLDRISTTTGHTEPDRVPVFSTISNWIFAYYGTTYQECMDNYEWYVKEVESSIYRKMNVDITMSAGLAADLTPGKILGYSPVFISEDNISFQHKEGRTMPAEDYPLLIKDPLGYFMTRFIPETYKGITAEKIAESVKYSMDTMPAKAWVPDYFKNEFGLPFIIAGGPAISPPFDKMFDWVRGFKNTLTDIRRCPEMLLDAIDALYPLVEAALGIKDGEKRPAFPYAMSMFHAPTYLSYDNFMKFFAPTYNKLLDRVFATGEKAFVYLEGTWTHLYPWLNNLPKNMVIARVEEDDIFAIKKAVGSNVTITGGMPINMLKYESKEKCIDYAKRVIDECAPGGGFLFSTNKGLCSPGDVNPDNYIAVNNFVYDYGKK